MIRLPRWLTELSRSFERFAEQTQAALADRMRAVGETANEAFTAMARQAQAAEQTRTALGGLPRGTRRGLVRTEVRCPGNALLLRVLRIPEHLPGAAYDSHLVVPTSSVTYQRGSGDLINARAWFLRHYDTTLTLRCRCHPGMTFSPEQLRGESPPPLGVRVLQS